MLSVQEFRKLLEKKYDSCSDDEIEKLRDFLYLLAEIQIHNSPPKQPYDEKTGHNIHSRLD